MVTKRMPLRHVARLATLCAIGAVALSAPVLADGPIQPDPPVPMEALPGPTAMPGDLQEPDCRCGALYARDLERRVEGHVERWESLPRTAVTVARESARLEHQPLRLASFVDGVVGFPLHDFRLANDTPDQPL